MKLYDLYKDGLITIEEYHQKLMEKFDAAIKATEEHIKELEEKNV